MRDAKEIWSAPTSEADAGIVFPSFDPSIISVTGSEITYAAVCAACDEAGEHVFVAQVKSIVLREGARRHRRDRPRVARR
jgi:hypothetical protein